MQDIDWNAMSAPWLKAEAGLERAHQSVLDGLMRRSQLETGQRVLDIGSGTGLSLLAAADAVGAAGHVTGVDIAPPLVARARARVPAQVEVLEGNAATLEYAETFDVAISLFGTMFFADTPAAFAHLRKAMKPGGRFVFAAWSAPPRNPWFGIPRGSVEAQLGPLPKPDPAAPGPFRFADAAAVIGMLEQAGWDAAVETEALMLRTGQSAEGLAQMHLDLARALMLADHDLADSDLAAIRDNLQAGFGKFGGGRAVEVPAEVHFFLATPSG
ncbi:MAG: class I SAM-dependent methyltransferase [Pseudomonadota bacterium]